VLNRKFTTFNSRTNHSRDVAIHCGTHSKIERMKKENLPLIIIIASLILIILNFIFTSDEMDIGFWLRIVSSGFIILAMFLTISERKKRKKNNTE